MELRPFVPFVPAVQAALVAGWSLSAAESELWCGRSEFPVAAETVAGWQQDEHVRAYLLIGDDDLPVGYGELWLDAEEDEVELARIILAPAARGRGIGQVLVRGLLAEAARTGLADIFLRVHPDNRIARRCYRAAGFVPVDPGLAEQWNTVQPVDYWWLRYPGS